MEMKQIAVIAVVALMALGAVAFIILSPDKDPGDFKVTIVAQANSEGSGIFVRTGLTEADLGGKIFMTPGPASIQHMMFMNWVKNDLSDYGYKFAVAPSGGSLASDTVYWIQMGPALMEDALNTTKDPDKKYSGGIVWEAYASRIILNSDTECDILKWSSEIWPNHPCCVLTVDTGFMKDNPVVTKRFVAAHIAATQWINDAIEAGPGSDEYELLEKLTTKFVFEKELSEYSGDAKTHVQEVLAGAFDQIKYDHLMSEGWIDSLEDVLETYATLGQIDDDALERWGLDDYSQAIDRIVDTSFLESAGDVETVGSGSSLATVRVGYLRGDVHQIAYIIGQSKAVGDSLGFGDRSIFEAYGLSVVDGSGAPYGNGGEIMDAFYAGALDFAYVGSPPTLLRSINQV